MFCVLLRCWCSSLSLHPAFFSSQIAQCRWCSSSSLHPVFFSNQIAYPTSLRSFFRSSVGSFLLLRSSFFFFFGSFFFFSGFFLSSSSFFFFWVCTFFVLYLKSSVKNSRSMWHNHVQLSKLGKWEASLRGSRLNRTRVSKTRDASLQFSFKPVLTYHILSLHNISMQISSVFTHQRMVKCNGFFKQMTL